MDSNEFSLICPNCGHIKSVNSIGYYECSKCGCKIHIDKDHRIVEIRNVNWKLKTIYKPNKIPLKTRITCITISALMLIYGVYGVSINDLYIPSKRSKGIHFHNFTAYMVFAAMLCAVCNLISVVIDHYDKRDNEIKYRHFAIYSMIAGIVFYVLGIVYQMVIDA